MSPIKNLLLLSARQRKLCKRLESDRSRLYRMAFAWTNDTDIADEIVQETMIKAMNNVDKVKNIDALDSWLFRVLSNCFIDFCRKQKEVVDIDDIKLIDNKTPESIHTQNEMLASIRTAISRLPFKYSQVITLVDIENFTYAEVSEIIDSPMGTIMSRLNRGRQSLKKILEETQVKKDIKGNENKNRFRVVE